MGSVRILEGFCIGSEVILEGLCKDSVRSLCEFCVNILCGVRKGFCKDSKDSVKDSVQQSLRVLYRVLAPPFGRRFWRPLLGADSGGVSKGFVQDSVRIM